ncbi:MAG TPA: ABC transporter permease [Halanaerobiales bacterium]|nr:ABC transporter permease [Halanaerobiales bacterium]
MLQYILRKLLFSIPVIIGVSILVFLMIHLVPGDPARIAAGVKATDAQVEQTRELLGLNDPLHIQFVNFAKGAIVGDFGKSIRTKRPISVELASRIPCTFQLAFLSLIIATTFGLFLGVISSAFRGTIIDNITMIGALFGLSMPSFWRGLMLILLFSFVLGWFPASGYAGPFWTWEGFKHLILPAISLGTAYTGTLARLTRSNMLEVLGQDYIRTARSKGLKERVVFFKHALRNALISVVTVIGLSLGILLGGAMITETVFSLPGIGSLGVTAILARDYKLVQAIVMLMAIIFVIVNLIVDIIYSMLDPRIKYD